MHKMRNPKPTNRKHNKHFKNKIQLKMRPPHVSPPSYPNHLSRCERCLNELYTHSLDHKRKCHIPSCQQMLKRGNFLDITREDALYSKDIEVREKVLAVYNKTRQDFQSLDAYDEYLIQIEDVIDQLMGGTIESRRDVMDGLNGKKKVDVVQIKERHVKKSQMNN